MSTSPIPVEPGQPRPYQPTRVEGVLGWFNLRRRGLGSLAFVLNRLTGLAGYSFMG